MGSKPAPYGDKNAAKALTDVHKMSINDATGLMLGVRHPKCSERLG